MSGTKTLFIVRHAKSSWSSGDLSDHDRPLNERGLGDAPAMAAIFAEREDQPQHWVSSTALRAKTTANYFAEAFSPQAKLNLERGIYDANVSKLYKIISAFPADADSAIMFGHNPGFSDLSSLLTSVDISMSTCCIVKVKLHIDDWQAVAHGTGSLEDMDFPKKHASF